MKDRDNHTHRTGVSLVLQPRPRTQELGVDALIRYIRILAKTTENIGACLDYNELTLTATGVDAYLVVEYERTRAPGRNRDRSYRCFRDDAQASAYLEGKLNLICSVADAMGVDIVQWGTYHETL
jgi:hypothetical protein